MSSRTPASLTDAARTPPPNRPKGVIVGFLDKWTESDRIPDASPLPSSTSRSPGASQIRQSSLAANRIPIVTTETIPGFDIVGFVSLVTATSTLDASVGTRKQLENELRIQLIREALDELTNAALSQGANAITGLALVWAAGNLGGATIGAAAGRGDKIGIIVTGNAVITEPTTG